MESTLKKNNPVLFLDSGIGGIPYCSHYHNRNPGESIIYLADRAHFPYGKRSREEISSIVTGLAEQVLKTFNPKIIILACNTASLASISKLRERFPDIPFVGTEPAVKPAVLASKTGKIGVLGTEFTIKDPHIRELAARHGKCEVVGIPAPELVEFVENRFASAPKQEKLATARSYLDRFRKAGVDGIVLGCTHFLFLLDEFRQEAKPDITVFESINGISLRIESLLAKTDSQAQKDSRETPPAQNRLLLTGKEIPSAAWTGWADYLGFSLSVLEES